jgi:hypothetical protein
MGSRTRLLTSLALLVACGLAAQEPNLIEQRRNLPARVGPHAIKGHDRPDLRRDWNLQWFGGKPSPAYLDYKNRLAIREMQRWGQLLPQAQGTKPLPAIVGTAAAPMGIGGTWMPLGPMANSTSTQYPDIDSGRPSAIAVDPGSNTLYLAASGGGVWRCANADPNASSAWTWEPITDGLPNSGSSGNVSVGALALSPVNPQVLYLGLGDAFDAAGRGFYKSADGGSSWTAATGLGAQTRSYFILALDAKVVLWGTNDGLKLSTDGGLTFAPVASGPTTGQAWSIQAFSATALVCSAQDSNGTGSIYYSSDAGANWTQAALSGLNTITPGRMTVTAVPSGTTGYAEVEDTTAADIGRGVLVTSDKGQNWSWVTATTPPFTTYQADPSNKYDIGDGSQEWYNQAIAVDPSNPQHLIMGSNLATYRSLDGGATWQQLTHWYGYGHVYSHADFHTTAIKNGVVYMGNDGGLSIFKNPWGTIPTGTTRLPSNTSFVDNTRNKGLATHLAYSVGSTTATNVIDGKYRISLGLQDNGTRLRQPNSVGAALTGTETTFEDMIGGDGFATLIHPSDGNQMLGSLYYTDIYKSTDGGQTFNESISGLTGAGDKASAPFQPRLALGGKNSPGTVYTATNYTVFKSTNFGNTWAALPTTGLPSTKLIHNLGAAENDPQALGVVTDSGLAFLSYNGGSSWNRAGSLPNNSYGTSYIWFDRTNSTTVYAASVALVATANHLWKSTDQGATWTAIDGSASASNGFPFGIPVHVVQTDPADPNTLYAGTDFGVYVSSNGGTSWARFGSGLPMVAVRDLYLASDGSFIRAATFGRGVWEVSQAPVGPAVTLSPTTATLVQGGTHDFTPTVSGGTANTVTWAATSGTIAAGPTATAVAHTYSAPATGSSDTVTATTVDAPAATATATITLVAPSAVSVTVAPVTVELLTGTTTQAFSASVSPLTNQTVAWSGTGVSGTGLFSATGLAAGSYTVTATSTASPTSPAGTATVTLVSPGAVSVTVAPSTTTLVLGATRQFTATVAGVSAGNQGVSWSLSPTGTISGTGLFTASAVGSFTLTATNTFSGATGTATITVKSRDVDANGTADLLDLLFFAKQFGTANAACDLNGDGTVNDADLDLLIAGL